MKLIVPCTILLTLTACASSPPLSPAASRVQFQSANSTLLNKCKVIGPVQASADSFFPDQADVKASNSIREQAARMGGDVVAITNRNVNANTMVISMQGTAMKCYPQ